MKTFWKITEDHIDDGRAVGVSNGDSTLPDSLLGTPFKMFDDDNILYYEGLLYGDYEGFEPLDDYGMPNAGCTSIQLYEDGEWKVV